MTTMNRERERSAATAAEPTMVDTSFIEGTSGRRVNSDSLKIQAANLNRERMYPNYGRDGNFLTLKVSEKYPGKVVLVGPRGFHERWNGEPKVIKNRHENSRSKA